jgi:4-hydroxybenzoate polyprenyltransferase
MYLLSLLVVSSLWISFIGALCPALICIVYGLPIQPVYCLIAFLATWPVYASDKVSGSKEDLLNTPERAILANWPIKQLAIISYCLAIIIAVLTDWHKVPFVLSFGMAGWIYTRRICGMRPKDIPGLKNLIVATACAACYAGLAGTGYAFMFLMILINTILFDIRDIKGDAANGVRTIPVLLGSSRTIMMLACLDGLLFVLSPEIAIIGIVILWYFRKDRPSLQYDYIIDGWILSGMMILLAKVYILQLLR